MLQNYSIALICILWLQTSLSLFLSRSISANHPDLWPRVLSWPLIGHLNQQSAFPLAQREPRLPSHVSWTLWPFHSSWIQFSSLHIPAHFGVNTKSLGYVKHDATRCRAQKQYLMFYATHVQTVWWWVSSIIITFFHLSWRCNTQRGANRTGQMSSPFKMELSSWSHGNCDINTWSSQESCHLMRTWSLLAALSAAAGGNSWLLLAAAVVLLCCCGQGTDPSAAADAEEQSGALLCLPGSPITTFYDKTPKLQDHCDHFMSLSLVKSWNSPRVSLLAGEGLWPEGQFICLHDGWNGKEWEFVRTTTFEYKNNCNACSRGDMTTQSCILLQTNADSLILLNSFNTLASAGCTIQFVVEELLCQDGQGSKEFLPPQIITIYQFVLMMVWIFYKLILNMMSRIIIFLSSKIFETK